ncbi:unnamed protein product [Periconia digitata]|uniref:Uncharacterized protein n=1 Tax=Periconia digitata TaxID=1303443 RepID=A0A9W4U861_9PLEO|nr:unnamed protein product [Periconia digitata]
MLHTHPSIHLLEYKSALTTSGGSRLQLAGQLASQPFVYPETEGNKPIPRARACVCGGFLTCTCVHACMHA